MIDGMTKKELRLIYKEKRKQISVRDKNVWDDLMLIQFQRFPLNGISTVFSFIPIEQMNEPNTDLFLSYLQAVIPGIRIAYPVTNFETGEMFCLQTDDDTIYEKNSRGIVEPVNGKLIPASEMDLIIVPLLVFDKNGNRCGYGKGFYDKYLSLCRADSIKLGFSYFEPVDKIQDTDTFDVPLTHCITPQHIYEFQ